MFKYILPILILLAPLPSVSQDANTLKNSPPIQNPESLDTWVNWVPDVEECNAVGGTADGFTCTKPDGTSFQIHYRPSGLNGYKVEIPQIPETAIPLDPQLEQQYLNTVFSLMDEEMNRLIFYQNSHGSAEAVMRGYVNASRTPEERQQKIQELYDAGFEVPEDLLN